MQINLKDNRYIEVTIRKGENDVYQYYLGDILIGIYDVDSMKDSKFFTIDLEKNNTIENELSDESKDEIKQIIQEIKEQIDKMSLKEIQEEAKIQEEFDKYIEELGLDKENVKSIKKMDLEREEEQAIEPDKEEKDEDEEELEESATTIEDINIKQEVELNERANEYNLRKWLGNKVPNEFTKIGVIESDEMSKMTDKKSSTRYDLVVIGKDGHVEPLKNYIPELEQNHSSGNNPTQEQYQIDTKGEVEKDAVLSEYRIGKNIIQLDKDIGNHIEFNIGKYSPSSNDLITTQMRDKNTQFATDIEVRKAVNGEYKGVYQTQESYDEAKEHEEAGCEPEEMTYEEIDGNEETGHKDITNEDIEQYVEELMQDEDISAVFTEREVRQRLEKNFSSKSEENRQNTVESKEMAEKIKEDTKKELEQDSSHFRTQ